MGAITNKLNKWMANLLNRFGLGMRSKLIIIFLLVKVIPLIFLAAIAWRQFSIQGGGLTEIAVNDSAVALNDNAVENIERMSTDMAQRVADFLYSRDDDILYVATLDPSPRNYQKYVDSTLKGVVKNEKWVLDATGSSWILATPHADPAPVTPGSGASSNIENNDKNGFRHRPPEIFEYDMIPIYDEITFIDLEGNEIVKALSKKSSKIRYPMDPEKKNISKRENTYVKAETYFEELKKLKPGEIYVSDVIGAYVGSNYIGMYAPTVLTEAAEKRGYAIEFKPEEQAYAGLENPNGIHFEGIVRWATPVTNDSGQIIGYVTLAMNHDHIMEFVDHITPMNERYVELPSAYDGNYAFIWDYKCRNIAHPRHHSIVGFDPETGDPQIPWLEESVYAGWQASGLKKWTDFTKNYPIFFEQSRTKKPALELTKAGFVGLDGRYLNNAPQCTGWMDLTGDGGSGSFYILWSGLYKLNTAAAIPYYTGHYAPSEANGYSRRGFGFIAIGSSLDFFTMPARETEQKLLEAASNNLRSTFIELTTTTIALIVLVVFIAIWMASFLTDSITNLIKGISRFRAGERQFRFDAPVKDEFGTLADSFDDMADSIAASVKNPLCITDMDHNIIYMNECGLAFRGRTLNEIVGRPYGENSIYPPKTVYDPIWSLEEGREPNIFFVENSGRYIRGTANYFLNAEGEKIGIIIESADVTEMVEKQLELEQAMNNANMANEHKGEFLARMSHEIRTPMNAIIGLANIVQRNLSEAKSGSQDCDLAEVKDHVRQIESSSQHLLCLLNDILDISKIEAGKISLSAETVDLLQLMDTVFSIIKPRCDEKNITFKIANDTFSPSTFSTDALRLRQVLINLLGNAVKFCPPQGRIEFNMRRKDRRAGETLVEFIVSDTGIGISPEEMATIFQPFEQASGKITRKYGGTGLGLTISQHIVQLFGGDITVRSQVGQGSEFSFAIWLTETESVQAEEPVVIDDPAGMFTGRKVLLVDDVDLNRKITIAMLKRTGVTFDEAEDGLEALRRFSESPENTYDIILMDVQMPNMDGYEASLAIRALNREDAKLVPIVALTANAFQDDIDKALLAGMNDHVAKPVKMNKLVEILFKFLAKSNPD